MSFCYDYYLCCSSGLVERLKDARAYLHPQEMCPVKFVSTRRMQGIVGASGKFILFLSSMFFFIIIKNIHAHMHTIAIRI